MKKRCEWAKSKEMIKYHDKEWGLPVHDDKKLFEFLVLEGAQAGLSWSTILKKRKGYRKAFADFNVKKVSEFSQEKVKELLQDHGIIRNKLKVNAAVTNAQAFLKIQKEFGSFNKYSWEFVGRKQIVNKRESMKDIPATTKESDVFSKDLKNKGFKFVGSTIMYAHMQAVGMVNDHVMDCFRYKEVMNSS
tara:strand:- start:412 stop:981 length:570 start_codon:yes stop_codon:yes gene_type:complete